MPVNTVVGSFSSTDPNPDNTFTYSLVSGIGDSHNDYFNISGSSLRTSERLDYETNTSFKILVRSTDQGGAYYEESFRIYANDVKENSTTTINSTPHRHRT